MTHCRTKAKIEHISLLTFLIVINATGIYLSITEKRKSEEGGVSDSSKAEKQFNDTSAANKKSATLVLLGDISFHGVTQYHVEKGNCTYNESFDKIKPVIEDADYVIGNLESGLGGHSKVLDEKKVVNMYAVEDAYEALKYLGVDVATIANNHILDFGGEEVNRTVRALKKLNIGVSGITYGQGVNYRQKPLIFTVNGVRIGMLSYCDTDEGCITIRNQTLVGPAILKRAIVEADVKELRGRVDIILFFAHWLTEYTIITPFKSEHKLFQHLIRLGIDIIVGSHPHVTSFHFFRKGQLLVPSLGNFLYPIHFSNQDVFAKNKNISNKTDERYYKVAKNMDNPSKRAEMIKIYASKKGVEKVEFMKTKIEVNRRHCLQVLPTSSKWYTLCSPIDTNCIQCLGNDC